MSPVDPSAVEPSPSIANAPAKIDSGVGKERDLAAVGLMYINYSRVLKVA